MRSSFISIASKILKENEDFALVLGDISTFGFKEILKSHPDRALNLGVLEQTMVGISAGLSLEGMIPTIHTIAPFLIERALEQIKIDFGYQKLSGNLVSVGASFDYSTLGATHHCPGDITVLSSIPGICLFLPGSSLEIQKQFESNWNNGKLNYFRLSEFKNSQSYFPDKNDFVTIANGKLATVIVVGPILDIAKQALQNIDVKILYINSIDTSKELNFHNKFESDKIITIEPYFPGFLADHLIKSPIKKSLSILRLGVEKIYIDRYGRKEELLKYVQLDAETLRHKILDFVYDSRKFPTRKDF